MSPTVLDHDWYPGTVPANVSMGAGSWLYSSYAFLHYRSLRGVSIGDHSGLYNGCFFDLGPEGEVVIGNWVTVVGGIFATNARITVGDYAFIAHEVVFADGRFARPHGWQAGGASGSAKDITVGEGSWIGMRAIVLGGARIGRGAIVGAAAVVDCEVPDLAIVAGNPARIVGWASEGPALK